MEKQITCIQCPVGCTVTVEYEGKRILNITGNQCAKGKRYAEAEFFCSKRVLTTTVFCKTEKGTFPLPVKTEGEIPLDLLREAVVELRKKEYTAPVNANDIVYQNILGTNIDVIATKDMVTDAD